MSFFSEISKGMINVARTGTHFPVHGKKSFYMKLEGQYLQQTDEFVHIISHPQYIRMVDVSGA